MKKLIIALTVALLVSGCSSREEADTKLGKGCEAGVKALLGEQRYDRQLDKVKKKTFEVDDLGRKIIIEAVTKNKEYGYETDEVFTCVFSETYSFGFIAWNANLESITIGEEIFGRENGQIKGDLDQFMRVTDAIADAIE